MLVPTYRYLYLKKEKDAKGNYLIESVVRMKRGTQFKPTNAKTSYKKKLNPPVVRAAEDADEELGSEADHHAADACLM